MSCPSIQRILLVEDDEELGRLIIGILAPSLSSEIRAVTTIEEARAAIAEWAPDFIILDFELPDGNALDLIEDATKLDAMPTVLLISQGKVRAEDAFGLYGQGVAAYLPKPFDPDQLLMAIAEAMKPPNLKPHVRRAVGKEPLGQVVKDAKEEMIREAMGRAGKRQNRAADILGMSPQLLNYLLNGERKRARKKRKSGEQSDGQR